MSHYLDNRLPQPEEYSGEEIRPGDFWMVRTGGVFYEKVKVVKKGWFSIKVVDERGKERKIGKVDFVRKAC